jgi:uncharacterized membrane protein YfcA
VRGGRGTASRTVGLLGAIFTYAIRHGMRSDNPVHGVMRPVDGRRERRLSDDEYAALGASLRRAVDERLWPPAIAAARFLVGAVVRHSASAGSRLISRGAPPAGIFKATFVVIACVIDAKFLIGSECRVVGIELPGSAAMSGYGFVIGLATSLMGISGGSLVTMVLLYGKPIHNAVATAAGLGVPITLAGTIGYALADLPHLALLPPLSVGFVSVLVAPVSSWAAPFGARLTHKLPKRKLEISFGLFLLAVAARFLLSLAPAI